MKICPQNFRKLLKRPTVMKKETNKALVLQGRETVCDPTLNKGMQILLLRGMWKWVRSVFWLSKS